MNPRSPLLVVVAGALLLVLDAWGAGGAIVARGAEPQPAATESAPARESAVTALELNGRTVAPSGLPPPQRREGEVTAIGESAPGPLFSLEGDAPGHDLSPGLRPEGATRLLTARGSGQDAPWVRVYTTRQPATETQLDLARKLQREGWRASPAAEAGGESVRLYTRGASLLVLSIEQVDEWCYVTLLEGPAPRAG